jgi:hypothetical protein
MKFIAIFLLAICIVAVSSCGKIGNVTFYEEFNQSQNIPAFTLPVAATDSITSPDIATNVESQLQQNNTSPNLVQSVKLQTMTLTITTPPGQSFAYLQNIQVFILTDSIAPAEIASQYNISTTSDTLNMTIDNTELKLYLLTNSFKLKFVVTSRAASAPATTINAYMKFKFVANVLAAL